MEKDLYHSVEGKLYDCAKTIGIIARPAWIVQVELRQAYPLPWLLRPLWQRGSSFDPSSTVQETGYLEPLWVRKTMCRHPLSRAPLALLTIFTTSIVCPAVISTAPLRGGRLSRIHTEMQRHSYPSMPEAITEAASACSTSAPSLATHRARSKCETDTMRCGVTVRSVLPSWLGHLDRSCVSSLHTDK